MPHQVKEIRSEVLPLFIGQTTDITLPSGRVVKIRETNGADDEILSSLNASVDGSNTYNFLASIIINDSILNRKPTVEDIKSWPINDKYGLLFKQRLFIHGQDLRFRAVCTEESCQTESVYTEDLKQWDTDLSKDIEPVNSKAISPYPLRDKLEIEFSISSGKKFKYSILTGVLEKSALELKDSTQNSPLIVRNLAIENKGEWILLKHFGGISSKEMLQIRQNIKINDKQFDPIVYWNCSNPMCRKEYNTSLFRIGSFFYPEEIL